MGKTSDLQLRSRLMLTDSQRVIMRNALSKIKESAETGYNCHLDGNEASIIYNLLIKE